MKEVTTVDAADVSPAKGDKYSPRLYRYLKHDRVRLGMGLTTVHRDRDGVLWIGRLDDGDFIGSRLISVLCGVTFASRIGCYPNVESLWKLKEVKSFWPRYLKVGRCAIDPKHQQGFVGDEKRYVIDGHMRICQWCGQVQRSRIKREVIKHVVWSNA